MCQNRCSRRFMHVKMYTIMELYTKKLQVDVRGLRARGAWYGNGSQDEEQGWQQNLWQLEKAPKNLGVGLKVAHFQFAH